VNQPLATVRPAIHIAVVEGPAVWHLKSQRPYGVLSTLALGGSRAMSDHGSFALGVMQVCEACGAMLVAEPVSAAYPSAALAQPPSPCPPAADAPDRTAVGITGLLRREQQKEQRREDDMEQAFSDLSALTDKARQMVRPPPRVALPLLSVGVRVDGSTGVFMRSRSLYFLSASTGARSFIRESPNQEHLSWVSSHPSHQNPSTRAAYKRTSGSSEPPHKR